MGDVKTWPKPSGNLNREAPKRIDMAADYGLLGAVKRMEGEWGTIEAYNRLVEHCDRLRAAIDKGGAKPPAPYVNASYIRSPIPKHMKR